MKASDIPTPVWWLAVGIVAAGAVYFGVKRGAAAVGNAVNPGNPNNIFAGLSNDATRAITGDNSATLGTAIYNFFHPNEGADIAAPTVTDSGPRTATAKVGRTAFANAPAIDRGSR